MSTDGGRLPAWSPRGGEILYRSRDRVMSATVSARGAALEVATPRQLFVVPAGAGLSTEFKLAPDGQRLLMARSRQRELLTLVLNWPRELARLSAAGRDER